MIENTEPSNAEPAPCSVPARHAIHLRGDCPVCLQAVWIHFATPECRQNHGKTESSQKYALFQHDSVPPWFCLSRLRSAVLRSLRPFVAVRGFCSRVSDSEDLNPQLSTINPSVCTTLHHFALLCSDFAPTHSGSPLSAALIRLAHLTKSDQI